MIFEIPTMGEIYNANAVEIPDHIISNLEINKNIDNQVIVLDELKNAYNFWHLGLRKEFRVAKSQVKFT